MKETLYWRNGGNPVFWWNGGNPVYWRNLGNPVLYNGGMEESLYCILAEWRKPCVIISLENNGKM